MTQRQVVDGDGARRADLAAIHVAKKALGWDDDMYRDVMFAVCRVRSSAELDFTGRKTFLAHLRECQARQAPPDRPAARKMIDRPLMGVERKMFALWQILADAGRVRNRSMAGLNAYCRRQTGVDRLQWLNGVQRNLVIESLRQWIARPDAAKADAE